MDNTLQRPLAKGLSNDNQVPTEPQTTSSNDACVCGTIDGQTVGTTWIDGNGPNALRNLAQSGLMEESVTLQTRIAEYTGTGVFDVYVEAGLLPGIRAAVNTYVDDLTREGYEVSIQEFSGEAAALKRQLTSRWQKDGLEGTLFVGDLPYVEFTSEDNFNVGGNQVTYPHDLYFMDLNGNYTLSDIGLDQHTGEVSPEIYVSRLTTGNLSGITGQSETALINSYFAKNHAYRTGQLTFDNRGVVFADDDWSSWGSEQMQALYGEVLALNDSSETTKATYLATLGLNYESVLEAIHSSSTSHSIKVDDRWEWISNREILETNPRAGFYNLFNCSSADFTVSNNLIGIYVYGGDYGLNAIGSTKTGGMLNFPDYYRPQGENDSVGQSFLQWFEQYAVGTDNLSQDWQVDWFYGMTMQGDPTLKPAFMGDRPGEIVGSKWNDLNGDGLRQAKEPGLVDWTIYLDQNQNNQLDDGEVSTVTDTEGNYKFLQLMPDTYTVAEQQQAGWIQTNPTGLDNGPEPYTVSVSSGKTIANLDFGNQQQGLTIIKGTRLRDRLVGTTRGDDIRGSRGRDRLTGLEGSDVLQGGKARDTLIGVNPHAQRPGLSEIDTLIGGRGKDRFILGDRDNVYYDDGQGDLLGLGDYALIADFSAGRDRIQLSGHREDYTLGASPFGSPADTAIFLNTSPTPELIGLIRGGGDLSLSERSFQFVV